MMHQLPQLAYRHSPNQSARRTHRPWLIVMHRPVGEYKPSIDWLCNPKAQASAHVLTEGRNTGVDVATQLVPWDQKAWACETFNSPSYNIEVDDDAWDGDDPGALLTAERLAAFLCLKTGIPAKWSHHPLSDPGIIRHYDLGRAGGGHTDPTTDPILWKHFLIGVQRELDFGHFRQTYGKGRLVRI